MRATSSLILAACALLSGCAPSATFVSADPPPGVEVVAGFSSDVAAVTTALRHAMAGSGITVKPDENADDRVVGMRQQVPYVGHGADDPAPGDLPLYRVTAAVARPERTRVRLEIEVVCPACDGSIPYEWEYPVDLLREVIEKTRKALGERAPKVDYPRRHRPSRWRPPGSR